MLMFIIGLVVGYTCKEQIKKLGELTKKKIEQKLSEFK